ncbi:MAG: hypothetical protein NTW11_02995 [Candidatus Staskawiczbacteria bacterium]|nr:hypothetical protein [Candidatus Staskawiczbacteria bacterium]
MPRGAIPGRLRIPTDQYKRITDFVNACRIRRKQFTLADIRTSTGVSCAVVASFLLRRTKKGFLRRLGTHGNCEGCGYTYSALRLLPPPNESSGTVANAVWTILFRARAKGVSLEGRHIFQEVNKAIGRQFSRVSVHAVILNLFRRGTLLKIGDKYLLREGLNERPAITDSPKVKPLVMPR